MIVTQSNTSIKGTIYGIGQGYTGQCQGHTGQGKNMQKFYFCQLRYANTTFVNWGMLNTT